MNAEISAYSSGDLHKYAYLTKKDLNYKPNAFEEAKFEYLPLGKVFTDGLNKTDKKGLLKRLKNIESKSNNQLLALKNISKPAITGSDDDINNKYKKITEDYKNNKIKYEEIKEQINEINNAIKIYKKNFKKFENIPNVKNRVNKNEKLAKMLKKFLDEIITNKKIIDITWVDNPKLSNKINNDVTNRYHKDKNSTELLPIQSFLDDINNEHIENKKDAYKKFKDLKNSVKSDKLKDIVKELEDAIFGYDYENEESSGSGLKILTNKQMLNRLPILLAQIQAGNNSTKLKNEARQILYSLYRSKVLTKIVYNNLIRAIHA